VYRRLLLVVILLAGRPLAAQTPDRTGTILRVGGGLTRMDFTCADCAIDAQSGGAAFVSLSRPIGSGVTVGLEGTFATASFDGPTNDLPNAKLFGPMATAGLRHGVRVPAWATLGFGWLWYSGVGPNSSGLASSLRAGLDLPIGGRALLSPYAGLVTMVGHDGPEVVTGDFPTERIEPTRLSSFQLGLAVGLGL
jgi:hypothetical protein